MVTLDKVNPGNVDDFITELLSSPLVYDRLVERLKYHMSHPNRFFFEALHSLEDDTDIMTLLRVIHRQDESIAYLSHQLVGYDSMVAKYDKLSIKVLSLKRQNKRLLDRNKELTDRVYRSKNNC